MCCRFHKYVQGSGGYRRASRFDTGLFVYYVGHLVITSVETTEESGPNRFSPLVKFVCDKSEAIFGMKLYNESFAIAN